MTLTTVVVLLGRPTCISWVVVRVTTVVVLPGRPRNFVREVAVMVATVAGLSRRPRYIVPGVMAKENGIGF